MANKLYDEASIQAIADAIRSKTGTQDTYTVQHMAEAIENIKTDYQETVIISFPSSLIGETWTVSDVLQTEVYTGTVNSTYQATVILHEMNTNYTIECGGASALYTTGGTNTFDFGDAIKIINSMTSLQMSNDDYTDSYNINYKSTYSSVFQGNAWNVFDRSSSSYWITNTPRLNQYIQLQISIPCKILEFEITGDLDWHAFTYAVQGSNDGTNWDTIDNITTAGTGTRTDTTTSHSINPSTSYSYYRWLLKDFTGVSNDYLPKICDIKFTRVTG